MYISCYLPKISHILDTSLSSRYELMAMQVVIFMDFLRMNNYVNEGGWYYMLNLSAGIPELTMAVISMSLLGIIS